MRTCLRSIKRQWHWIFFAAVVLLTVGMDVFIAQNILDGDASDHMYRGWTMAQDHNLFTRNYYYTTEVGLLGVGSVFSLFFCFISDWTLVRILGTILLQSVYVLSFFYMCRQAHVGCTRVRVFSAALLLLPFSVPYGRVVVYHLYYILYLTNAFWMIGLSLRLTEVRSARKAILPACLMACLWVFVGLNGIRHMMILGVPMLVFVTIQTLRTLTHYRWENGRLVGGDGLFLHTDSARLMGVLLGSFVFFFIGYVLNVKVVLPAFEIMNSSTSFFQVSIPAEHYATIFSEWLIATGVRQTELPLLSVAGVSLAAALFSFGYLLWASATNTWKEGPIGSRLMGSMLIVSLLVTTLTLVFDAGRRCYHQYFVPVVAFAIPALTTELARLKDRAVSACRKLLILLTCACFLFQGAYTMYYITADRWSMDKWSGIPYTDIFLKDTARIYLDVMQENGYTHALVPYWYASVMMEMTDGELTVGPLYVRTTDEGLVIDLYRWGTSKTAFVKENLPERLLVIVSEEQVDQFEKAFPHLQKVFEYWHNCGYEATPDDLF